MMFTGILAAQQLDAKTELVNNITQISSLIDSKSKEVDATIKNYNLLQSKIDSRNSLVGNLSKEKKRMESTIDSLTQKAKDINLKLGDLRKEYGRMLKMHYTQSLIEQRWAYILSSSTLLEGYKKWIFSKQYRDMLNKQKEDLYGNMTALDQTMAMMQNKIDQKEKLIQEQTAQKGQIQQEEEQKKAIVADLKRKESEVRIAAEQKQKQKKQLNKEIETMIVAQGSNVSVTPSANFNPNLTKSAKGTLLWPIENAVVTGRYGKHPHPSLKHVEVLNNGIDLDGGQNKDVRLVYDGEVVGRKKLGDKGIMIIVKHGDYYSVYSQIVIANVRAGDKISQGTIIGSVQDELHFEIWQGKEKLNPIHWLIK